MRSGQVRFFVHDSRGEIVQRYQHDFNVFFCFFSWMWSFFKIPPLQGVNAVFLLKFVNVAVELLVPYILVPLKYKIFLFCCSVFGHSPNAGGGGDNKKTYKEQSRGKLINVEMWEGETISLSLKHLIKG